MNTFTPQKFIEGIASIAGIPELPTTLCVRGLAKKSESESPGILTFDFSPGSNCKHWIPIPASLVEKIDHLGKVPCKDHQHDFVCVHFANPKTDEGKALSEMLKQLVGLGESWNPPAAGPPSSVRLAAAESMPMASAWHAPNIATASWPPHPPNWPWDPHATAKSRITVSNRGDVSVWVKISKACGGGDDSYFKIEPGDDETWRRCIYHDVTITLSSHGGNGGVLDSQRHTTAVSTGCNHYAVEAGNLIYLGPPNCL
ncbi:MAG: hypothetical protein ACR2FY_17425 [Pirellulaceae bacterium]